MGTGSLSIVANMNVHSADISMATLQYLKTNLLDRFQIYSTSDTDNASFITFKKSDDRKSFPNSEGYELNVGKEGIAIVASDDNGFFHAVNSLLQLMQYHQDGAGIKLPLLTIKDVPAYGWRGFMLDESRHFFGKEKVKQLLDWMAYYKLNTFHWHLTDEPAWRIEIQQYPFLALVGGIGNYTNPLAEVAYYKQEDIKEIIAYAAARHIEVIPEVDMPGHATAANRAYPQFSGGGTKDHPDFTFHPAKEGTYQYLSNILKEINVLFPSRLIHLGGDEVAFGSEAWNADQSIQTLKDKYGYATNKEVETYFMRRMADTVFRMGSKLLVWDEMADAGLPTDKTIQYWWRHDKVAQLELCLKNGYRTVICPRLPLYFDFVQDEKHTVGRKWGKGYNSLESLYDYDLAKYKSLEKFDGQILGLQANLWTERIHNEDRFDFMVFPRIAALAEIAWTTASRKDFGHFQKILKSQIPLYKAEGIYYFDPFDNSNSEPKIPTITKKYIDNPE
jgi:hexosaminidase